MIDEDRQVLFMGITGSHAYGLARPDSDVDVRGAIMPIASQIVGLDTLEQVQGEPVTVILGDGRMMVATDTVFYSLPRFVRMALQVNPNIVELLFLPKSCICAESWQWGRLMDCRADLLSRRVRDTYIGFALSELHRIEVQYAKTNSLKGKMGMHAVRLLRTGRELLLIGNMTVDRKVAGDAEELLNIRDGKVPYHELVKLIEHEVASLGAAFDKTVLPEQPNKDRVNRVLTDIMCRHCASTISYGSDVRGEWS